MTTRKLIFPAQSLMELAWLYAATSFVATGIMGRPLTFVTSAGLFYVSTIASRWLLRRGLRNATIMCAQAAVLACISLMVMHTSLYPSFPLFHPGWARALFSRHSPQEWLHLVIVLLTVAALWGGATTLAIRKMEYRKITARFDIGLVVFFCLFVLKLGLKAKGGIVIAESAALPCLFLFLSAALPAIALARLSEEKSRTYLPGYGLLGVLVSFTGMVFFAGAILVVFFTTLLRKTADAGYEVLQKGALGLFSLISPLVRFLFGPRDTPPEPSGASGIAAGLHDAAMPTSWWGKALYRVMDMGVKGLIIVLLLAGALFIAYVTILWLSGRKPGQKQKRRPVREGGGWFVRFRAILRAFRLALERRFKRKKTAADVYASLTRWGRLTGVTPMFWQTPSEFTHRLAACFPALDRDIGLILAAYTAEVYGRAITDAGRMAVLRTALRHLRHPRHWPARARVRITGG